MAYMSSGPVSLVCRQNLSKYFIDHATPQVVAMVWEGKNAVVTGRKMLGATNPGIITSIAFEIIFFEKFTVIYNVVPADSAPGTIRGDYALDVGKLSEPIGIRSREIFVELTKNYH